MKEIKHIAKNKQNTTCEHMLETFISAKVKKNKFSIKVDIK